MSDDNKNWVQSSSCNFGNCVQMCRDEDGNILMRHSADPDGIVLTFTPKEWEAWLLGVQAGEFDYLVEVSQSA